MSSGTVLAGVGCRRVIKDFTGSVPSMQSYEKR
jgi:hypothetical protein